MTRYTCRTFQEIFVLSRLNFPDVFHFYFINAIRLHRLISPFCKQYISKYVIYIQTPPVINSSLYNHCQLRLFYSAHIPVSRTHICSCQCSLYFLSLVSSKTLLCISSGTDLYGKPFYYLLCKLDISYILYQISNIIYKISDILYEISYINKISYIAYKISYILY